MATLTVYPDAGSGNATIDANVGYEAMVPFSDARAAASANVYSGTSSTGEIAGAGDMLNADDGPKGHCTRGILTIANTLVSVDTITGATLAIRGYAKSTGGSHSSSVNVYSASPTANNAIAAGDYALAKFGSTAWATAIGYSSWSTSGYNTFTLNATGYGAIVKGGITKFGIRETQFDVGNGSPSPETFATYSAYFSDAGTGYKPTLTITYTPETPAGGPAPHYTRRAMDGGLITMGV